MKNGIKTLQVPATNLKEYLQLFNGIMNLTPMEMEIFMAFVVVHLHIQQNKLLTNPFSTEMKKKVATHLGKADFNTLNVYIQRLHKKGVIHKLDDGYEIDDRFIPEQEGKVIFELITA